MDSKKVIKQKRQQKLDQDNEQDYVKPNTQFEEFEPRVPEVKSNLRRRQAKPTKVVDEDDDLADLQAELDNDLDEAQTVPEKSKTGYYIGFFILLLLLALILIWLFVL